MKLKGNCVTGIIYSPGLSKASLNGTVCVCLCQAVIDLITDKTGIVACGVQRHHGIPCLVHGSCYNFFLCLSSSWNSIACYHASCKQERCSLFHVEFHRSPPFFFCQRCFFSDRFCEANQSGKLPEPILCQRTVRPCIKTLIILRHYSLIFGSSASRMPSPRKLILNTVIRSASPGGSQIHSFWESTVMDCAS